MVGGGGDDGRQRAAVAVQKVMVVMMMMMMMMLMHTHDIAGMASALDATCGDQVAAVADVVLSDSKLSM